PTGTTQPLARDPMRRSRDSAPAFLRTLRVALELGHRRRPGRTHPRSAHDCAHGAENDQPVERDTAMIDVPDIERELLAPRERVAPAHLRQPRDARPDLVTTRLHGRVAIEILWQQGTRADHRHLAAQHVPELWQLVERQAAERASYRGQSHFVRLAGRTGAHRAELVEREAATLQPRSRVAEEHRRP